MQKRERKKNRGTNNVDMKKLLKKRTLIGHTLRRKCLLKGSFWKKSKRMAKKGIRRRKVIDA